MELVEYSVCNICDAVVEIFRSDELSVSQTLSLIETTAQIHRAEYHQEEQ